MKARTIRVIDADTVVFAIVVCQTSESDRTLPFGLAIRNGKLELTAPVRVAGCNAWERGTVPGRAATRFLRSILPIDDEVDLYGFRHDKYGRHSAIITTMTGHDVGSVLVAAQWAMPWTGKGLRPVPPWPRTVSP